eukprot:bmy_16206T0
MAIELSSQKPSVKHCVAANFEENISKVHARPSSFVDLKWVTSWFGNCSLLNSLGDKMSSVLRIYVEIEACFMTGIHKAKAKSPPLVLPLQSSGTPYAQFGSLLTSAKQSTTVKSGLEVKILDAPAGRQLLKLRCFLTVSFRKPTLVRKLRKRVPRKD